LAHKEKKVNSRILTAVGSDKTPAASRSRNTLVALRSRGTLLRAAALAAACFFSSAAMFAQGTAPSSAAAGKIGVISVRQAIASTSEGKQAGAELQSQFAARQTELENMNKQINELRQRLEAGTGKLSQDEQTRLQRQGETLARQLQRKQDEYQEDVNAAQADVFDRIGRKLVDVLDRYARENGYIAVLDSSAQNTPILFASTNIDVTQDIVRLYDQAYPIKGGAPAGAAAPKPAATTPKPATPPAPKPQQ
jgi:outer membrane protein